MVVLPEAFGEFVELLDPEPELELLELEPEPLDPELLDPELPLLELEPLPEFPEPLELPFELPEFPDPLELIPAFDGLPAGVSGDWLAARAVGPPPQFNEARAKTRVTGRMTTWGLFITEILE